jgi:predicted permease
MSYWQLLLLILPIFVIIGIGVGLRRLRWLTAEADASLLKLVVNFLYPCLIFENVLNNSALRDPSNLTLAPLVGFVTTGMAIACALYIGRLIGLTQGHGLRTFAFAVGINNYAYIPIPVVTALFPAQTLGLLLVYNVGCESAVWTVGILVLSGLSLREGWRKMLNPPVIALIVSLTGNLTGLGPRLPVVFFSVVHQCAMCAIPLGLLLIGGTLEEYLIKPKALFQPKITFFACVLRLGFFPLAILALARYLPCTPDLKRVIVVESAMPAGILSMVIAKHYGGQQLTAVQVAVGTTALGIVVVPLWLRFGLAWVFPF